MTKNSGWSRLSADTLGIVGANDVGKSSVLRLLNLLLGSSTGRSVPTARPRRPARPGPRRWPSMWRWPASTTKDRTLFAMQLGYFTW